MHNDSALYSVTTTIYEHNNTAFIDKRVLLVNINQNKIRSRDKVGTDCIAV